MEVVRIKKILAWNLLIYIGLHCVRRSLWTVTTLATLVHVHVHVQVHVFIPMFSRFFSLKNFTLFSIPLLNPAKFNVATLETGIDIGQEINVGPIRYFNSPNYPILWIFLHKYIDIFWSNIYCMDILFLWTFYPMDIFWFIKFVWTFHYYGQFAIWFFYT